MRKKYLITIIMVVAVLLITACGNADLNLDDESLLTGRVAIDGSGTVYPLMARIAEEYMLNEQPKVSVEVSRAGTSAGFQKFIMRGGTDLNNASRHIRNEELQGAEVAGFEPKELKIALDGLAFVIHPDNDWATELTQEQIVKIFQADGGISNWSDIDPSFPNEKIKTYGPNENHGTYEFFYEEILNETDLVTDIDLQQEYSTLVTLVREDINAIGFFGFGYYVNNQDQLGIVQVDFGNGPVEPTYDNIKEDGEYGPFTRPIFTYLNLNNAREKEQVLDFSLFLMEHVNEFADIAGFAPVPEDEIQMELAFLSGLN
ncbi:phosphate ABC transporter substrate-binding protein, PhoT family [Amphibacillus marinus]|uniref:Phosphate-binding protein n=1 Tax=Amphibacillus marinus TaxID=872970 RepID=A0A1H8NYH7_9BACI|nr:phosphate ABC transporter substrate-binding protein, PhoT family [Amphibacillus marinus]